MSTDKEKKYDRQLRLWGDHGQICLENARVCLVNAGATGTEILKNLILPGIGAFTIVDHAVVKDEDFGNNFFVSTDKMGKSRAAVTTELLSELNQDCTGDYVDETVEALLENKPDFFHNFNVVIVTDISDRTLLRLGSVLWSAGVPLVVCRSLGTIGWLRLVLSEHCIIETHPDSSRPDLRLDEPFSTLVEFCDKQVLENMTRKHFAHTPWLVVLFKQIQKYRSLNEGRFPQTYKEKGDLKTLIKQSSSFLREDGESLEDLENIEEAIRAVNTAVSITEIPEEIQVLLNDSRASNLNSNSKPFWFLVAALKLFVQSEGCGRLPLRGSLPDMTSDSSRYVELQKIYRTQAELDAKAMDHHVRHLCTQHAKGQQVQRKSPDNEEFGSEGFTSQDIRLFCKNASFLRVLTCSSLEDELKLSPAHSEELSLRPSCEENEELCWYLVLRAADRLRSERDGLWPGELDQWTEADLPLLRKHVNRILASMALSPGTLKDDYIQEMCRFGGSELHSVASLMGGVAAQEVIKIITGQFVPIEGTLIYNAVTHRTRIIEL